MSTALCDTGHGSASRLYGTARGHSGLTHNAYRGGGAGMQIYFTILDSPLGRLLVGATDRGISALYLGGSDAALRRALQKEYPRAELLDQDASHGGFGQWIGTILAHLHGRVPHLELPTDVQATAFQRRVWDELRRIPYGATRTYSEVARAIGRPSAIRAVARACATNPVSVVVPCHRVVRKDGNLAGYRWGIDRKRMLLRREAAAEQTRRGKS
jgi:AraC family transcriptional regulator of adaptative response/methylated-DNA-[protein]-cysteine methyltransferase